MRKTKHKKILPVHHTGRLRHHRHTSYGSLALFLLLTFAILVASSHAVVYADRPNAPAVNADESVYAVVAGPVPANAPVITSIANGALYTDNNPVTVAGTCPADTLIKIFKNNVLTGAAFCVNGRFSVPIDLFFGSNTLVVRAYNSANAEGPEAPPIVVQKNIAGITSANANQQLFITSDIFFKGINPGDKLVWPVTVGGGQAPYAVSVAWGDGSTDLISRGTAGSFNIQHVYQQPGNGYKGSYDITITATDTAGNTSFIHLVNIVGGQKAGIVASVKQGFDISRLFRIALIATGVAALIVFAFWLGEKRELRLVNRGMKKA